MLIRRLLSKKKKNWPKQPLIFLRYQSLSFAVSRCHSLYQSLSFVVTSYHSLSLDVSLVWHFINDLTKKAFSLVLIIIKKTKENEMINDSTSEWVSEWCQVLNKCANSSPLEVFYKKDALRNIWKAYRRSRAPAKVFFSEYGKIFEIFYFVKLLRVAASETPKNSHRSVLSKNPDLKKFTGN